MAEQTKASQEVEKKLKKDFEIVEQSLVEKEIIFEQMERKYKQRIEELLSTAEQINETPKSEKNSRKESIIIKTSGIDSCLQESLDR